MDEIPRRITDVDSLKVFTHPLRIALWRALSAVPSATASQLADQVDEAVSLVSYHLRKMAERGFIEPAESHGDARERWWKRAHEAAFSFRSSDFEDRPEGAAVAAQVTRLLLENRVAQYSAFLDQAHAWPTEWMDAAFSSDHMPKLTAAELQCFSQELTELAERWKERGEAAEAAGETEGRERVTVHFYGFPYRP